MMGNPQIIYVVVEVMDHNRGKRRNGGIITTEEHSRPFEGSCNA